MYVCPMHPEVVKKSSGTCPKCHMQLIKKEAKSPAMEYSYKPLVVIFSFIFLVTLVLALKDFLAGTFEIKIALANFMAGFFLVFSAFKFFDLKGFAEGYSTYDLLAKRWRRYGYIYPFLELGLGLLFALHVMSPLLDSFTFLLMAFSGLGVALKLAKHEKFQCACLGTFLKIPLTKVTLVEDFGMASMSLLMLILK